MVMHFGTLERIPLKPTPKITHVTVKEPFSLHIKWDKQKGENTINLSGWIATGGEILAPLKDPNIFNQAHIASYGRSIAWDDDDLAIDALHLWMLAEEQRPFGNNELRAWQARAELSNSEAADLVGVSLSTWNSYRVDAKIPSAVAIVLRSSERDPLLLQAHLRPRTAGRPRKDIQN